jgi:hypothetical protein
VRGTRERKSLQVRRLQVGRLEIWRRRIKTWVRRSERPLPLFSRKDVISWELSFVEV